MSYLCSTIAWLSAVRVFQGFGKAMTYSFQRVLPRLPGLITLQWRHQRLTYVTVPSLNDTCNRYLESVRPLLDDAEYDRMERLAEEFKANEGAGFQRILWLKSWYDSCSCICVKSANLLTLVHRWANNYVSDWWERFVYLRARDSLMINSNYYIMDAYEWTPTKNQAARAGNMVALAMQHKVSFAVHKKSYFVTSCMWGSATWTPILWNPSSSTAAFRSACSSTPAPLARAAFPEKTKVSWHWLLLLTCAA